MIGIGFSEIVIIGLIVIVFIKPKDIPSLMRKLGVQYKKLIEFNDKIRKEFYNNGEDR